ncbi:MAG: hypothetical protein KY460_07360 [Actinobacteria bacterium]|nr:hypothetical protein [Actinomycetota bacterium]
MEKQRLSATVEADLLAAGRTAVAEGRARNLSAWVNDALKRQAEHDRRMAALDRFLESYESEHGEITDSEIRDATRRTRARAVVVRASAAERNTAADPPTSGVA